MELNAKYFWKIVVVKNNGQQLKGDFEEWMKNFELQEYKFYGTEEEANKKGESLCNENETYFLVYSDVED